MQLPPDMIEPWMTCVESISTLPNNNGSAIRMKIQEATSLAETSERGPEISALLCLSIGSSVYRGNNGGGTKAVALHALEILKLKMVWRKHSGDTGGDVPPSALDAYFRPPRDESGVAPYDVRDDRGKGEIDPAGTASSCPISSRPGAYTDACEMAEIIRKTTPPGRCPSVRGGVPVDDIEGQKLFMTALEDFIHAEYNEVLDSVGYRIPTISGRKLNLTRLYREVCLRGGIGRVIRDKSWKSVASTFRFPPTLTGSSFTLRVHYQKFLEEYENRFFRKVGDIDGPVWTAANGNGKEDREKRGSEDLAQIAAITPGDISSRPGAYSDACEMAENIRKTTPPGCCPSGRGGVPVDDIEGRELFMTALEDFIRAEYNEVLDSVEYRIPTMSGRKLNLTRLYREVCLRGGIGRVIRDKSWKSVASTFRFPPTLTGSSFTLRVHYQKFLEEYENRFFRKVGDIDGPVWTAANGNGKEDREKRGGEDLAQIAAMIPGGIHSGGMGVGVGGGRNGLRGMDIGTVGVNGGVGAISSYLVDDENDENGECGERFTQYEDLIILHARQQVGNRWPVISRLLPNRSAQVIKKYWHARLKYKVDSLDALESLVDKSREEDRSGGDGLYSMNETARLHVSAALAALGEGKYLIMQQYRQHQLQPELLGAFMQATILAQQASLPMDYAYDAHPSLFPSSGDLTNGAGPHHFSTMRPPLDGCSEVTFVQDLLYFLSAGASHAVDVDSMGVPLWPEVYLNEIRLDVFNLYRGVVERGGFDVVFPETDDLNADTPSPAQEEVFREMRNYKEGTIGVGGVLRAHYEYLLLKYESERYDDDVRLVVS